MQSSLVGSLIVLSYLLSGSDGIPAPQFMGCYRGTAATASNLYLPAVGPDHCTQHCYNAFYRYAMVGIDETNACVCSNYLGEKATSDKCETYCIAGCDLNRNYSNTFQTGQFKLGPPRDLSISNVTTNSVRLTWNPPHSYTIISQYRICAKVLRTFSSFHPLNIEWSYPNTTLQTELNGLRPASIYNITVEALSDDSDLESQSVWATIRTRLGQPDHIPDTPDLLDCAGNKCRLQIHPVVNNNGPVTWYWIIVVDLDARQIVQKDQLYAYDVARRKNLSYYVTAQLKPSEESQPFVVGDGNVYGQFFNAPLRRKGRYKFVIAVISVLDGEMIIALNDTVKLNHRGGTHVVSFTRGGPSYVVGSLYGAIVFCVCLLVLGIVSFAIIRYRFVYNRRRMTVQRCAYGQPSMELVQQDTAVPVAAQDNRAFVPEEEVVKVNYYKSLKEKLLCIPYSALQLNVKNVIGDGRYGKLTIGSVGKWNHDRNDLGVSVVAIYTILDRRMNSATRRNMLRDLDVTLKADKHDNLLRLLALAETSSASFMILEYTEINLKEWVLRSREIRNNRFSSISEIDLFRLMAGVCKGMQHLVEHGILHGNLCANCIRLGGAQLDVAKVAGFGLTYYWSAGKPLDNTRWSALEVLRGQPMNVYSDVWSFACTLWEVCVLGGTPYSHFANVSNLSQSIKHGVRLVRMPYMGEALYELMLDCWQLSPDERPPFDKLYIQLNEMLDNATPSRFSHLSFHLFEGFHFEIYSPDLEHKISTNTPTIE